MALDNFSKQPYETFPIEADFVNVLVDGETITLGTSDVSAKKADDTDATSDVLTVAEKAVDESSLQIRVKDGVEADSPYKITFRAVTSNNNKYEKDVEMTIEEL